MVLEHLLSATAVCLLTLALAAGVFLAVVQVLYFRPGHPRRRMPSWLVTAVLMTLFVMPKVDTAYALSRQGRQQQEA